MISRNIAERLGKGSMIRKMFEEGNRLKAIYGPDNVYDFSLGNPDLEPPQVVRDAIRDLAADSTPGMHGYMSNNGYLSTRTAVARFYSQDSGLDIAPDHVCMTVGAAGGLNIMLKALLDPGDEVMVLAPFFFEYLSYIDNHGGVPVVVQNDPETLLPDLDAIRRAITPRTKALIINAPNNPSGKLYPEIVLRALDATLLAAERTIYVLSDEPYAELVYDGRTMPSTLACLTHAIICTSWSKSLSLPGERIGCTVVSPRCEDHDHVAQAAAYCNRTLGFVNAPALFQKVIERTIGSHVDIGLYEKRRNRLAEIMRAAGFEVDLPEGGLYLFPRVPAGFSGEPAASPAGDDVAFAGGKQAAGLACDDVAFAGGKHASLPAGDDVAFAACCAKYRILLVPGSSFQFPGHVRLCFAVSEICIENSAQAFQDLAREYGFLN